MNGVRETLAAVRGSIVVAARRVHPVVLFGVGLLAVAGLFAAVTLTIVGGTDGLDDLGLGSPDDGSSGLATPPGEGEGDDDAGATGEGNGLTDGLASRDGGSSTTTGGVAAGEAPGAGTLSPAGPSGAPRPTSGPGSAAAPAAQPGSSTTAPPSPTTTPPSTTATTTPDTTSTTGPPAEEPHPGLVGGLIDLLGLG